MFHLREKDISILKLGERIQKLFYEEMNKKNENKTIEEKIKSIFKIINIITYNLSENDLSFIDNKVKINFDERNRIMYFYTSDENIRGLLIGKDGINSRNLHTSIQLISLLTNDVSLKKIDNYDIKMELHPNLFKQKKIDKDKDEFKGEEFEKVRKEVMKKNKLVLNDNELVNKIRELTLLVFSNEDKEEKMEKVKFEDNLLLIKLREWGNKKIYLLLRKNVDFIFDSNTLEQFEKFNVESVRMLNEFFNIVKKMASQNKMKELDVLEEISGYFE